MIAPRRSHAPRPLDPRACCATSTSARALTAPDSEANARDRGRSRSPWPSRSFSRGPRAHASLFALALGLGSGCIRFRDDGPDASVTTDAGERETSDAASGADSDELDADDSVREAAPPPICQRFDPSIAHTIAENTISALLADCRINAYFSSLAAVQLDHFEQCLAAQLGSALGCVRADGVKAKYPAFDTAGKLCADMKSAHSALQTSDGDFDAFVSDLVLAMERAGLTTDEITRLTRAYGTTRGDIVRQKDAGPTRACDAIDAAAESGVDPP